MKKRLINLSALVLILLSQHAQSQLFGLLQRNPINSYRGVLNYPLDGKYRLFNTIADNSNSYNERMQLLVFSSGLQLQDSVNYPRHVLPQLTDPIKINNKLYLGAVYYDSMGVTLHSHLGVLEMDTNYKYIGLHIVDSPSNDTFQVTVLRKISGSYYLGKLFYNNDSLIIYKLNQQFVKKDSAYIKISGSSFASLDMQVWNNRLLLTGGALAAPAVYPGTLMPRPFYWIQALLKLAAQVLTV